MIPLERILNDEHGEHRQISKPLKTAENLVSEKKNPKI
jgi:hypothetical protein